MEELKEKLLKLTKEYIRTPDGPNKRILKCDIDIITKCIELLNIEEKPRIIYSDELINFTGEKVTNGFLKIEREGVIIFEGNILVRSGSNINASLLGNSVTTTGILHFKEIS